MAVNERLGRMLRGVRRWRGAPPGEAIAVDPDLPDNDWQHLAGLVDDTISARGGEVAARRRARTIAATYSELSPVGRHRFFQRLADDHDHDHDAVDLAIEAVMASETAEARRLAEGDLRDALVPGRVELLRRFAGVDDGLGFLVRMRAELLPHRRESGALAGLERDLKRILEGWFDIALLSLERLTWDSSASLLERLIEYEAVHEITSWNDLKLRLGPGRRCYAFMHPGMPDDPLIFVEVALTRGVADDLAPLLDGDAAPEEADEERADTAIFYSISNCHTGLAGVSLGDFLIKSVVEELSQELPTLKSFATLSPIPGFRSWLLDGLNAEAPRSPGETPLVLAHLEDETMIDRLTELVAGPSDALTEPDFERARPVLVQLAARYLAEERRSSNSGMRAIDGVAHFHLSNGAIVDRINWKANATPIGWDRGLGMMVNYRYRLKDIERNHDDYSGRGVIAVSDDVRKLLDSEPRKPDGE